MKKLVLLSLTLIAFSSFAQNIAALKAKGQFIRANKQSGIIHPLIVDTVWTYYDRSTNFYIYTNLVGGYVYGTGKYLDGGVPVPVSDATANHYDGIGTAKITTVLMLLGVDNLGVPSRQIVGSPDSIHVSIYNVAPDTTPTALLGTNGFLTSDFDTLGFFTEVGDLNAIVTSSFLIALEYGGIDDTFGLVCNDPDTALHNGYGDGRGEKRARQMLGPIFGNTWWAIDDLYNGQDADVIVIPVFDTDVGMTEFKNELFTLKPVHPMPSKGLINLEYTLANAANVSYRVMDAKGRIVVKSNVEFKAPALYRETIDLTPFPAGNYYVIFNAGSKMLTQKAILIK